MSKVKQRKKSGKRFFGKSTASDSNLNLDQKTHLVVLVHGIIGSAADWKCAERCFLKKKDVLVHRSRSNSSTLVGIDKMGEKLAEEVKFVIQDKPYLRKISFVAHSLGGLVSRYAIGRLYKVQNLIKPSTEGASENRHTIAGLSPINFITFATPHLGCRGNKQVPIFCGFHPLEKLARQTSWILRRTGKQLYLNDNKKRIPLLLQMVQDQGDLQFMKALEAFKRRVVYANTCWDNVVGWSTSSIRRHDELPKRTSFQRIDKYPHIVNVEDARMSDVDETVPSMENRTSKDMEETMIKRLNKVSWERVDVSFENSLQKLLAHSTIQVKFCWMKAGIDVISHMTDNFAEQL